MTVERHRLMRIDGARRSSAGVVLGESRAQRSRTGVEADVRSVPITPLPARRQKKLGGMNRSPSGEVSDLVAATRASGNEVRLRGE